LLRVGVIGLGKMGLLHASILNVLSNVQLVALCDKSSLILKFSKKLFNKVHVVKDIEKLSGLDLDVAYVTTPIFSHYFITKNVYSSRIAGNLFVEKTLASSYDEAKELCDLAQSFGGVNMVGYMKRFAVTFNKAKDLLTQEILGEVTSFKGYAYSSDFLTNEKSTKASSSRGGALRDLGGHVVDLALWFFGDLKVASTTPQSLTENDSEASVEFRVKKSDGLIGEFRVSRCMKNYRLPEVGFLIEGSKGIMNVNDDKVDLELKDGKSFTWYRHDLNDNVGFMLGGPEYFREDEYFINSVVEGCDAEPSFFTASKVDHLIDQVTCGAEKNV
jgi:predicted dehydrogenase